ncbi:MAG TPA: S9 family peptidase [Thermoanaerobaculia bacterium]|jgi:dipeptidyl aminopeptidase/acylaminoacyl peptidase
MKTRALTVLIAVLISLPLAAQKRAFTIEDLYRVKNVSDLEVSPDGKMLAFSVAASDFPRAKRTTAIWVMNADGSDQRQLTSGEHDSTARFSPDGRTLLFLRDGNIFLLPLRGGEARQLTKISTGVTDPVWSPDSKWIAFSSDVYPKCGADDACNERISTQVEKGKVNAHMSDELLFRHWSSYRGGMRTHTFIAAADTGTVRDLTPGDQDWPPFQLGGPAQYAFSPDSAELVLTSKPDKAQASSTNNDLYLIDLRNPGTPRKITDNPAYDGSPKYSPDGRYIAYRMQKIAGYEADLFRLAVYDRQARTHRVLTESFRDWVEDYAWAADSRTLYFSAPVEGRNPIFRVNVAGGNAEKVFEQRTIDDFEIARGGGSIVYIHRSVGEPSEIYSATFGQTPRRLTTFNETLMREVDIRPAEVMWVTGANNARVQVFIVKPHGFDPNKKYPLILNVHGGPQQQWADAFRGDWQVYPGAGYVVAFPNPHGSTGFGQDFTRAISGDWGGKPFEDVMKITDALEKLPYVDRNRIGAMGWSYGGYMMNWIEGHTDRYKAIASMMGIFDLRSFYYATEELWFPEFDLMGTPHDNPGMYEKWSPSNFVKNFKTPCLVITGEKDFRVPYTQSLQMFTALQKMNVPSRIIVFENAGHWPSSYEMALYYTAHLEWFHKYLGGGAPPWTSEQFLRGEVYNPETGERREQATPAPENPQGKPDVKPGT